MHVAITPETGYGGVEQVRLTVYLRRSHWPKARRHRERLASVGAAVARRRELLKVARERGMDGVCDLLAQESVALRRIWGAAPLGRPDGLLALVARFIAEKEADGRRARTIENLRHRLAQLTTEFGDLAANEVAPRELRGALEKVPGSRRNRVNTGIVWRNFFRWCWRDGAVREPNLMGRVALPSVERGLPVVATPWRVARLLAAAWYDGGSRRRPGPMLAYAVVTFFSALRPEEYCRLKSWEKFNLATGLIPLDERVTKVSRIRHVHLSSELVRVLRALKRRKCHPGFFSRRRWRRIRRRAGLAGAEWAVDLGRHTYASCEYAMTTDEGALSADMGTSVAVLRRHYLNRLVTVQQARAAGAVLAAVARKLKPGGR